MQYFEFIAIYEVPLVETVPAKVIVENLKLEFKSTSEEIEVAAHFAPVVPAGIDFPVAVGGWLRLPSGRSHLMCTVRCERGIKLREARLSAERRIDRALTVAAVLLNPLLLGPCLYRGWRWREGQEMAEGVVRLEHPVRFDRGVFRANFEQAYLGKSTNRPEVELMSRFFVKGAMQEPRSEERFLFMWTILEVFPMCNTSDIKAISTVLSPRVGLTAQDFKSKMDVGLIFGMRSDLVHRGRYDRFSSRLGDLPEKLEALAVEAIRVAMDLPYGGSFDRFVRA